MLEHSPVREPLRFRLPRAADAVTAAAGYRTLTLEELLDATTRTSGHGQVLLTLDDARSSSHLQALPLLARRLAALTARHHRIQ